MPENTEKPREQVWRTKCMLIQGQKQWAKIHLASFCRLHFLQVSEECACLKSSIRRAPTLQLTVQDLKDLLKRSWRRITQHAFRDLMESMCQRFRAVLVVQGGPTRYCAGGFNLMADLCISGLLDFSFWIHTSSANFHCCVTLLYLKITLLPKSVDILL